MTLPASRSSRGLGDLFSPRSSIQLGTPVRNERTTQAKSDPHWVLRVSMRRRDLMKIRRWWHARQSRERGNSSDERDAAAALDPTSTTREMGLEGEAQSPIVKTSAHSATRNGSTSSDVGKGPTNPSPAHVAMQSAASEDHPLEEHLERVAKTWEVLNDRRLTGSRREDFLARSETI